MKNLNVSRTVGAGFAGTVVMCGMMVIASLLGMPEMDIAAMLGGIPGGGPAAQGSPSWLAGLAVHFFIGSVVLATAYALALSYLPGRHPITKGVLYGAAVWVVAQSVIMPMIGEGFFSSNMPNSAMMALGSLMGHLIYGSVLGSIYGAQEAEEAAERLLKLRL